MEELNNHDRIHTKQRIEAIVKKKQEIHYRLVDDLTPLRGHTLYEIDIQKMTVSEAKYLEKKTITWEEALKILSGDHHEKVAVKSGCVYISALNADNAMKRYSENKGSAMLPKTDVSIKLF